ncbi:hypothetical protein [Sphingomonas sp. NFR04]|uniref:hypothetical protein n=1 Tax=Sphingomonas sp. NFR04 TaxID=1566283 RepID=UPI001113A3DD|nr:hypothetical protein [Sphingomonas sp. NFR04]
MTLILGPNGQTSTAHRKLSEPEWSWRPFSATDVPLSDSELAQLGLFSQLEAQCKVSVAASIKGLEGLDYDQFRKIEGQQFGQLLARLAKAAAGIDQILDGRISMTQELHEAALTHRNQSLHSWWAWSEDEGEAIAFDLKRRQRLAAGGLEVALREMSALTFPTKACLIRVVDLIAGGIIPGSADGRIKMFTAGRWVSV